MTVRDMNLDERARAALGFASVPEGQRFWRRCLDHNVRYLDRSPESTKHRYCRVLMDGAQ